MHTGSSSEYKGLPVNALTSILAAPVPLPSSTGFSESMLEGVQSVIKCLRRLTDKPFSGTVAVNVPPPAPNGQTASLNETFILFAGKMAQGLRHAKNLVRVSLFQFNTVMADNITEAATVKQSIFSSASKYTKTALIFNIVAAGSATLVCGMKWLEKASQSITLHKLEKKLTAATDLKDRAELQFNIKALKEEIHSGKWSLLFNSIASVSCLVGSVGAVMAKSPAWVSSAFGCIGFGAACTIAALIDLKEDIKKAAAIKGKIREYEGLANSLGDDDPAKAVYQMKADALKTYLNKYNRWKKVEDVLLAIVGVTAVVGGIVALTAAGAASFGIIPLAVALGTAIAFKLGIASYQNLKGADSRKKAKLAIKLAAMQLYATLPGVSKSTWNPKIEALRKEYIDSKAVELTKNQDPQTNVNALISDNESEGAFELKDLIAAELGLFDEYGNADGTLVKDEHIKRWLITS